MNCSKVAVAVSCMVFAIAPGTRALAENFTSANDAPKWNVYDFNRPAGKLRSGTPRSLAIRGTGFDFSFTAETALIGTSHPTYRGDLLGDLSTRTVSARVGITVTPGTVFSYSGEADACGNKPAVRFFFRTNISGDFHETDYWWSDPVSLDIASLASGERSMTVSFDPQNWSDFYGHFGNDPAYADAFNTAVRDVQFIGLSFGGGCFFQNGVGIEPGTGSGIFRVQSFLVN
ncbi:MAG TPA: hypothetical protein VEV17_17360 [Bryobacteraceae bacterium]|nr:hypothetical protein [Bryobacteraceae bacterium]